MFVLYSFSSGENTQTRGRGGTQQTGAVEAFLVEAVSVMKTRGLREGLFFFE